VRCQTGVGAANTFGYRGVTSIDASCFAGLEDRDAEVRAVQAPLGFGPQTCRGWFFVAAVTVPVNVLRAPVSFGDSGRGACSGRSVRRAQAERRESRPERSADCVTICATMKDRSADRHLGRRQRTHFIGSCGWCGDLVMRAADVPGRRPRFCSPGCKQAAYRARRR